MRVVQRSPDLGIGIRLKRVSEATVVVQDKGKVLPPVWWGWAGEDGVNLRKLQVRWARHGYPDYPFGYWPGLWTAVVEGAKSAVWAVEFTPKVWMTINTTEPVEELVWSGDTISLALPQKLPETPETLFTPSTVELPTVEFNGYDVSPWYYWEGAYTTPTFPSVSLPNIVAAGNTLSVSTDTKSMSGTLVAKASVEGKLVGSVELELLRANQYYGS